MVEGRLAMSACVPMAGTACCSTTGRKGVYCPLPHVALHPAAGWHTCRQAGTGSHAQYLHGAVSAGRRAQYLASIWC